VRWIPRRRPSFVERVLKLDAMRVVRDVNAVLDEVARNADLLHLHSNGLIIEAAARYAKRRGRPYILTLYGTEIWHYRPRWPIDLFTRAYSGATHVTFYSRKLRERAEAIGLGRPRLVTVYPPVSDRFAPRDEATRAAWRHALGIREPHVILNVKRLHELAGQRFLIDAFAEIARGRMDVRLIICGTGSRRADLESHARTLGVAGRVTFAGLVPNDDVARYDAVADVFALPSLLEALPTVAVEALASGTPVVSADHPGGIELHEIFGDDVAIVARQDAPALARALSAVLDAPRRTTTETAVRLDEHFRMAAVTSAYTRIYTEAIQVQ
jgi:glycosyltransferase involved in cell wall biosynthesis